MTAHASAPPRPRRGAGRIVALVLGALLLVPGVGLLGAGGVLLWADWFHRSDGFVVSPEDQFSSPGYALVSEAVDLRTGVSWLPLTASVGTARIEVTGTGSEPVFVGVAPVADAADYLDGVRRTTVDGLGFDGPPRRSDQVTGGAPAGPPTRQHFWTAQSVGSGTQRVSWDPTDGNWMFVVMNADGSAGVDVRGRIGAEAPSLAVIGWSILGGGVIVTLVAGLLLAHGIRRPPAPGAGWAAPTPRGPSSSDAPAPATP